MKKVIVVDGKYTGRIGEATPANSYGNVMFYSEKGTNPYRVCLKSRRRSRNKWTSSLTERTPSYGLGCEGSIPSWSANRPAGLWR